MAVAPLCMLLLLFITSSFPHLHSRQDHRLSTHTAITRVAFLFAGSPRSFVFPFVHESIRENLINALCNPPSCIPDIFIRISLIDNTHSIDTTDGWVHGVKDSRGVSVNASASDRILVKHALNRLLLNIHPHSVTHVTWVDSGSLYEQYEMKLRFPSSRQRAFRELDPRRYSMYFSRWAVYDQAASIRSRFYSWFVHSRLDLAFGAPVKHHSHWSPTQIHIPDIWLANMPDIFAIIPRQHAEAFFSMEAFTADGVLCFGGPNFDMSTLDEVALRDRKFTALEVQYIVEAACKVSGFGWSEKILRRKLEKLGISATNGTVAYSTFFAVIIRRSGKAFCENLHPESQLLPLWGQRQTTNAMIAACSHMISDVLNDSASCIAPAHMGKESNGGDCVLRRDKSDWNFLPFRIRLPARYGGSCLTAFGDGLFRMESCKEEVHLVDTPRVRAAYSIDQLFYLYPLNPRPQVIRLAGHKRSTCLAALPKKGVGSAKCDANNPAQLLRVVVKGLQKRHSHNTSALSPILRTQELVSIRLKGFCAAHSNHSTALHWERCTQFNSESRKARLNRFFILERSVI